jgi:hypothetical protein
MRDMKCLEQKRLEVLEAIKPICDAFDIRDYDYIVSRTGQTEILRVYDTKIGCSANSIFAVKHELIGLIFIKEWCRYRSLGAFSTQTKNVIKRYWLEG